jgi:hypothetical protein
MEFSTICTTSRSTSQAFISLSIQFQPPNHVLSGSSLLTWFSCPSFNPPASLFLMFFPSFVDPGFQGNLVFELQNVGKVPIELYAGLRVAQISFNRSSGSVQTYGAGRNQHYKDQLGPEGSKFYLDKDFERINERLKERNRTKS